MRRPDRACTLQRKDAHTRVVRACMHQHVQVELLEQCVVRRGAAERHESSRDALSAAVPVPATARWWCVLVHTCA